MALLAKRRFEATREAVSKLHEVQLLLSECGDDWKPEQVRRGGLADPTASRAAYNVDELGYRLEDLRRQETELIDLIGLSLVLIERVRQGLGAKYADVLDQRYIDCLHWKDVLIEGETIPRRTGQLWVNVACDWIDSVGVANLLRGNLEV